MTLYEIDKRLNDIWILPEGDAVDVETGEILDEAGIEMIQMERKEKIENIAMYIKNLNAEAEALKAEKLAFAKRQSVCENRIERLKSYLSKSLDGEKFETTRAKISFRQSRKVEIAEGTIVPDEFCKIEKKPMLSELKKAIDSGVSISGVSVKEVNNIQIK